MFTVVCPTYSEYAKNVMMRRHDVIHSVGQNTMKGEEGVGRGAGEGVRKVGYSGGGVPWGES